MKRLLPALVLFLVVVGCKPPANQNLSEPSAPSPTATPSKEIEVKIDFEVQGLKTRRPKIAGTTNLPDQTQLMTSIRNKSVNYMGQDIVIVRNGKFESGEYGKDNGPLLPGGYDVDVVMPIPSTQSQGIQEIIGKNGENLKGPLVNKDYLGVTARSVQKIQIK